MLNSVEVRPLVIAELNPPLNRTLVKDKADLAGVADFIRRTPEFGFDTETNITKSFSSRKIRTIQLGNRSEQYVIDLLHFAGDTQSLMHQGFKKHGSWAQPIVDVLRPALDSKAHLKIGANLIFDYIAVLWSLGIRMWNVYDVQVAEKVIYAGQVHFMAKDWWALDDLVGRYCRLRMSKEEQKGFDLETPLTESQIDYAALDTRLVFPVKNGQAALIEQGKLWRTVKVENDALPAFGELHLNGLLVSQERWMANDAAVREIHAANLKALDTHFIPYVGLKSAPLDDMQALELAWKCTPAVKVACPKCLGAGHEACEGCEGDGYVMDSTDRKAMRVKYQEAARRLSAWKKAEASYEGEAAINYGSPTQVLAALRKAGFTQKVLASTNDKMLSKHSDKKIVQALQAFRETEKEIKDYGQKWLDEFINPDTGRGHATFNQMGAETGRTSASNKNVQNLKKEKRVRSCFVARPGNKIITSDMAGAELRIMADDSEDEAWIYNFEHDYDQHSIGASEADNQAWLDATLADCAFAAGKKKCNCPKHRQLRDDTKCINFGIPYGLEGAALAGKLKISKAAADAKLAMWKKNNPGIDKYLVRLGEQAKMNLAAFDMIGRRRLFKKPTWEWAAQKAVEREAEDCKKFNRPPKPVDAKMVGRVYYAAFGSIEREGKNMKFQATNATIAKITMGCGFDKNGKPFMWHLLPKYEAELCNFVHDEFVNEAPAQYAEDCRVMVEDCILRAGAEVLKRVKMLSESHVEDCWSK